MRAGALSLPYHSQAPAPSLGASPLPPGIPIHSAYSPFPGLHSSAPASGLVQSSHAQLGSTMGLPGIAHHPSTIHSNSPLLSVPTPPTPSLHQSNPAFEPSLLAEILKQPNGIAHFQQHLASLPLEARQALLNQLAAAIQPPPTPEDVVAQPSSLALTQTPGLSLGSPSALNPETSSIGAFGYADGPCIEFDASDDQLLGIVSPPISALNSGSTPQTTSDPSQSAHAGTNPNHPARVNASTPMAPHLPDRRSPTESTTGQPAPLGHSGSPLLTVPSPSKPVAAPALTAPSAAVTRAQPISASSVTSSNGAVLSEWSNSFSSHLPTQSPAELAPQPSVPVTLPAGSAADGSPATSASTLTNSPSINLSPASISARGRKMFSPKQTEILECAYQRVPHFTPVFRQRLGALLGLTDIQISKWHYRRRTKAKAQKDANSPFSLIPEYVTIVDEAFKPTASLTPGQSIPEIASSPSDVPAPSLLPPASPKQLIVKLKLPGADTVQPDQRSPDPSPLASDTGISHAERELTLAQLLNQHGGLAKNESVGELTRLMLGCPNQSDRASYLNAILATTDPSCLEAIAESRASKILRVWMFESVKHGVFGVALELALRVAAHLPMTVDRLRQSKLGVVVKKIANNPQVKSKALLTLAQTLCNDWQKMAAGNDKRSPVDNSDRVLGATAGSETSEDRCVLEFVEVEPPRPGLKPGSVAQESESEGSSQSSSTSRLSELRQMFSRHGSDKIEPPSNRRHKPTRSKDGDILNSLLQSMVGGSTRLHSSNTDSQGSTSHDASGTANGSSGAKRDPADAAKRIANRLSKMASKPNALAGLSLPPPPSNLAAPTLSESAAKPSAKRAHEESAESSGYSSAASTTTPAYAWPQLTTSMLVDRPEKKVRSGRRVTFAPTDQLTKVKEFYSSHPADFSEPTWDIAEDTTEPATSGWNPPNTAQIPHEFGNARDLDRKEGYWAFKQPRVETLALMNWYLPRRIAYDPITMEDIVQSLAGQGKESTERIHQADRERKVLSVTYTNVSKIPATPRSPPPTVMDEPMPLPRAIPFDTSDIANRTDSIVDVATTVGLSTVNGDSSAGAADTTYSPAVPPSTGESLSSLMQQLAAPTTTSTIATPATAAPAPTAASLPNGSTIAPGQADVHNLLANAGGLLNNPQPLIQILSMLSNANAQAPGAAPQPAQPAAPPLLANTQLLLSILNLANASNPQAAAALSHLPTGAPNTSAPMQPQPATSTNRPQYRPQLHHHNGGYRPSMGKKSARHAPYDRPHDDVQDDWEASNRPSGGGKPKKHSSVRCKFYFTAKGCFKGNSCTFSHQK
ncbi:hypothetical protein H4R35_002861 [Dimargaris xerosporica]|nr:hypothetical protein H4R35_002861 [Dimargaris xerosporica]